MDYDLKTRKDKMGTSRKTGLVIFDTIRYGIKQIFVECKCVLCVNNGLNPYNLFK